MIPERVTYTGQSYKLFDDYNDIHIFVEDAGFENLYKILLNKNDLKINKIFSINGKESVIKAAESCSDSNCIFLVDRDWDDLLGLLPKLDNVIVLDMYSIENYLINYDAFCGIVISESPKCEIKTLLSEKLFEEIIIKVSDELRPLFECFVSLQMISTRKKGCKIKPGFFQQKNKTCEVDCSAINNFVWDSDVSISLSVRKYFSEKILIEKGHGKYMLHYIWEGVRHNSKIGRVGIEKLMIRLAQLVDSLELEYLLSEIKLKVSQA